MFIRKLKDCKQFVAGDNSLLREILHPDKEDLSIRYSLAYAVVNPGETTALHSLKTSEVYYILSGSGLMEIDGSQQAVSVNDTVYIPPEAVQRISNTASEDLVFLCIVDPAWRVEDEKVVNK